jgi:hypothetical protein
MIATLHHVNSFLSHAAFTLGGMILVVIALCIVSSFFLIIITIGTASAGAYAVGSRWDRRRGTHRGAHERIRLGFLSPRANRARHHNNSIAEK